MRRISLLMCGFIGAGLVAVGCGSSGTQVTAGAALSAALTESAQATSFRMTQSTAQTISTPALGIESRTSIDPDNPMMISEVTLDATHVVMDMGALLGGMSGLDLGPIIVEMWIDVDNMVVDTRSFQTLLDLDPTIDLGPFSPGVSFVDLKAVGAGSNALVAAVTGSGPADLGLMADRLSVALADVQQVTAEPRVFRGSASFAAFTEAVGSDIEVMARTASAGIALNLDVDVESLADIYIGFYEETPTEVTVELDDNDLLSVLSTHTDLSNIYSYVFTRDNAATFGLSESELDELTDLFSGSVLIIDTRITFEPVDGLVVPPAPETNDDRTAVWRDFLISAGML